MIRRYWGAIPIALAIALLALRALLATAPLDRLAPAPSEPRDPPGSHALAGSLAIARGGPVIVGFQSETPARLTVAGRDVIGRGTQEARVVLPPGATAIRFATAGDARLVWHPVGRRGDEALEYVPASSLAPEPPERAAFGAWAGASPLDGTIAAALLLIIVGTLCMLARARLRAVPRDLWIAIGAVFAVACIVRWIDLSGFGQTWDEDVNWSAGRDYITNILALDLRPSSWAWNGEHPPVMKYLAGIGAQFADGYGPARALSAVWISLGCALLVPIGARLYRLRVGVLAGAIAALLPPLVAHGQIVGHESPSVLWWTLAILLALGASDGDPSPPRLRARLVAVGAAIGIATASRFINGLCGPLCLAIVVVYAPAARRWRTAIEAALILPATALCTLYLVWPRLWLHPLAMLGASLATLSHTHETEPFLGIATATPPPYYFCVYLVATLPLGALVGAIAWGVRSARARDRSALVMAAWLVIPLGVAASPVRQDGVRYVLPCVVALALCAAAGWDYLASLVERRARRAFLAIAGALVVYLAIVLVRIHPYYLDYFAEQTGGAGNVAARGWFETAWWGEGVASAVGYINAHAPPRAKVSRKCLHPLEHIGWFREDLWNTMVNEPADADWVIVYSPSSHPCAIPPELHRVFAVDADGATIAEVWAR
ncbi:MAG TPA: glycosyltransferase family 39 protein [Kofleriaceae bacterium]|nr:glycosyltransferase family 39 protein [Kofleriaceae bacterium]